VVEANPLIEGTGRIDERTVPDVSPHPRSRKVLCYNLLRPKEVPFVSGTDFGQIGRRKPFSLPDTFVLRDHGGRADY